MSQLFNAMNRNTCQHIEKYVWQATLFCWMGAEKHDDIKQIEVLLAPAPLAHTKYP